LKIREGGKGRQREGEGREEKERKRGRLKGKELLCVCKRGERVRWRHSEGDCV